MTHENEPYQTDEPMIVDPDAEPPEYVTAEGTHTVDEIIPNDDDPLNKPPFIQDTDNDKLQLQDGQIIEGDGGSR